MSPVCIQLGGSYSDITFTSMGICCKVISRNKLKFSREKEIWIRDWSAATQQLLMCLEWDPYQINFWDCSSDIVGGVYRDQNTLLIKANRKDTLSSLFHWFWSLTKMGSFSFLFVSSFIHNPILRNTWLDTMISLYICVYVYIICLYI